LINPGASGYGRIDIQALNGTAEQLAEKANSYCHSERSEESLCARGYEDERFLVAPLAPLGTGRSAE
jgi:hypothetical protein